MSREMRSCRSLRACRTFVSASVGGSQEKSSTSGREAQEAEGSCPTGLPPAPRNHRPAQPKSSPAPFRAMLPLSPLGSPDVTYKQSAFRSAPPPLFRPRMRAEMAPLRRQDARSGACLRRETVARGRAPHPEAGEPTLGFPGRRRGVSGVTPLWMQDLKVAAREPQREKSTRFEKSPLASVSPWISLSAQVGPRAGGTVA